MHLALEKLYTIQLIDSAILDLKRRLRALDLGVKLQEEAAAAKAAHEKVSAELHALQADLLASELEEKSIEEKKAKFAERLYSGSISNPKELTNTEKEVEALARQLSRLDDKVLNLWETLEVAKTAEADALAQRQAAEATYAEHLKNYTAAKSKFEAEWTAREVERKAAVAQADPALYARYQANRQQHGGVGISKITDDNRCGACGNSVPTFVLGRLKEGTKDVQSCENCHRILFLAV